MNWFKKVLAKIITPESDSHSLLGNFTPRAIQVMALANEEALRLDHPFIGTEHILLGLHKLGSGVATNVLVKLGLNLEKARVEVEKIDECGPDRKITFVLPFTPRAKEIFKLARNEARLLNHTYIGTEHLLLGILIEGGGVATWVLKNCKINIEQLRKEILKEITPIYPGDDSPEK
jgi:ATP-dependent Clp protease ATP-binding subunit ClpC